MDRIQLEQHGAVAWVWLNRPERLNVLDQAMIAQLVALFEKLRDDDQVRVVVLAGRGSAFCAGFDIEWMAKRTPDMLREDRADLRAFYTLIETCPQPVICAVQGSALGGGLIFTLVADFVVAADSARFGAPEVKIGVFPSLNLIPLLERVAGLRAAKTIVLTGEPVGAETARQMGLITDLVTSQELYAHVQKLAEQLAAYPPTVLRAIKAAFRMHPLPEYHTWETETAVNCWSQPERLAAMRAFLDKHKPE